jgi:RNA 3'-terminal phosphate cyclase
MILMVYYLIDSLCVLCMMHMPFTMRHDIQADQLLVYMALAPGTSEILCAPLCQEDHSQHIEAAIDVISQFTHRQFEVEVHPETKSRLIRCEGA